VTGPSTDTASGSLSVVGLGPGAAQLRTPAASAALAAATDIVGYQTYLQLAGPFRADQRLHTSDNREELHRARHAFALAAGGARVAIVSSGDPGIFAMAAAVLEALEHAEDPAWHQVQLRILPGVSAAQAAAALAGAPLGHDFCTLSLSDNLKPWAEIERRLALVCEADLVLALYNPRSKARPAQFGRALALIRGRRAPETLVLLGRDLGRDDEQLTVTTLAALTPDQVDMRTVVIIGSSQTRRIPRADGGVWVYTPRSYPDQIDQ
jgi:precorrin-3B C17-methyltransferase